MIKTNKKAFTLIELLIVITIIGILAAALIPKIASGPGRARDVSRKSAVSEIASALELYYSDSGTYVLSNGECTETSYMKGEMDAYFDNGMPKDADSLDFDNSSCPDGFWYGTTDGSKYTLCAHMENGSAGDNFYKDKTASTAATSNTDGVYYCITKGI